MYEHLRFRRQFLLSRKPLGIPNDWKCVQIRQHYVYAHPDLDVTCQCDQTKCIVILGSIYSPDEPQKDNCQILKDLFDGVTSIDELFQRIKAYAGRYALLYEDAEDSVILSDPLALREIYYCSANASQIICGSQPNLIAEFSDVKVECRSDPVFQAFYHKNCRESRWDPRRKWIGDETLYEGIKHLLPNHYLNIDTCEIDRYWPNAQIGRLGLEEAVERSCSFLQGSLKAIVHRHSTMLAVTAGLDSRTLLAASRGLEDRIYYFINDEGLGHIHPDIRIPKEMFRHIGIPFHVHTVAEHVDNEFAEVFFDNTFFASKRILRTIYNVYFKEHPEKVNLLGIGEIGRTRYGNAQKSPTGYLLAYKLGHKNDAYAIQQGEQILSELLPVARMYNLNVLTLLYWEHTMGNWGSTGNAESDIAVEEHNPFDSHFLYETFLGVDRKYTKYDKPVLFNEIIRKMWPELLQWPINPPSTSVRDQTAHFLKRVRIYPALRMLRYHWNRLKYSSLPRI